MIISGNNISIYGLKLLKLDDYYSKPARKKVLEEMGTESKDIVFQSAKATVSLLGRYESASAMLTALNNFETMIKSNLIHAIELVAHNETFNGVFASGYEVTPFDGGRIIKITAEITIQE